MQNILILTIGLPRSGKSTWAKQQRFPIVSKDALRLSIHGERFLPHAELLIDTLATYMVRSLFLAGHTTVIVDECHVTKNRRERWRNNLWLVQYQTFHTSKEECIKRAQMDNDYEIVPVIERMAAEMEAENESLGNPNTVR